MRIGFDHYTIGHRALSAEQTLEFARSHNLDGVQFLDAKSIDAELDPGRLTDFRRLADRLGLYLELGIPSPNPARSARVEGRKVEPEDMVEALVPYLHAAASLGCAHVRAYIGDRHDRFRADIPWETQLALSRTVIERLRPTLRTLGLKIAVETHADVTVAELLRLVESLGPEIAGVTLDTGNLPMRLEEPVQAVGLLAPWVLSTHVKDAVLALTDRGLCWQARPIGSGILPMTEVLAVLARERPDVNLSIELHPRTYDLPIYDPHWLKFFPELTPAALAATVRLAALCETRYDRGELVRPEVVEAIPWADRDLDWIARSVGFLRMVVGGLERF